MSLSSIHSDPIIINVNEQFPDYNKYQSECEKHKPTITESNGMPVYVQATYKVSNDTDNWRCKSYYSSNNIDNLDYQPSDDKWACCKYTMMAQSGTPEEIFIPRQMKDKNKDVLSVYKLESQLKENKNKLQEVEVNLRAEREHNNKCTNICGDRTAYINDAPRLNPLTEYNNFSYKPSTCNEPKGSYATQLDTNFNVNKNPIYEPPIFSTDAQSLICCGLDDNNKVWIPKSVFQGGSLPKKDISGFISKSDIKQCKSSLATITKLETSQKEYVDKINNITSQLVKIGKKVSAGTDTYDACYNYLEKTIDYTALYNDLNSENIKIKNMLDAINKIDAGTKISEEGMVADIYQYIIYSILSVLLIGICVLLLVPALQKLVGIDISAMVKKQKIALKTKFGKQ